MIRIRLKELAEAKGLTKTDISHATRATQVTIASMWRSEITQREKLYNQLCSILGCTPGELIEYIPDPPVKLEIQSATHGHKAESVSLKAGG